MYLLKNGPALAKLSAANCFWATTESTVPKNNKTKNKMESSTAFSTIYLPLSVRVNTPLPFKVSCAGSYYVHALTKLGPVRGIRNLSTKLSENKFNVNEEFLFLFSGFTDAVPAKQGGKLFYFIRSFLH